MGPDRRRGQDPSDAKARRSPIGRLVRAARLVPFRHQPRPDCFVGYHTAGDEIRNDCDPATAGPPTVRVPGELYRGLLWAAGCRTGRDRRGLRRSRPCRVRRRVDREPCRLPRLAGGGDHRNRRVQLSPPVPLGPDVGAYPHAIAKATEVLRQAGIEGPYTLAIGPRGTPALRRQPSTAIRCVGT